jgi:hypothetical protein
MAWDIIRVQADRLIAHLALELGPRRQRGDGVDRHDVDGARAHEHVGDLQRLLAVVGLGDEQLVDVHADLLGVQRVHGVLGVDERAHAAELLRLGEDVVDERRLARGLRPEDLDDAPARHAADAEREVEREGPGGDRVHADLGAFIAHAHHGTLAELALDLRQRALQGGVAGLDARGVRGMVAHLGVLLIRSGARRLGGASDGRQRRPVPESRRIRHVSRTARDRSRRARPQAPAHPPAAEPPAHHAAPRDPHPAAGRMVARDPQAGAPVLRQQAADAHARDHLEARQSDRTAAQAECSAAQSRARQRRAQGR